MRQSKYFKSNLQLHEYMSLFTKDLICASWKGKEFKVISGGRDNVEMKTNEYSRHFTYLLGSFYDSVSSQAM
jgi:hypothetical protein